MKRDYERCVKEHKIRPIERLDDRSVEIVALVQHKREFWRKVRSVAEAYPTLLIESHYQLIKELLTALLNKEGFKSETHDCLFYHVEKYHPELELDFEFLHELRRARNEIDYRGVMMPKTSWTELKLKIHLTIETLMHALG